MFWFETADDEMEYLMSLDAEAQANSAYQAWCDQEMQKQYEAAMAAAWFQQRSHDWLQRKSPTP